MCEQVPHGRAGRTRRFVEVDHTLLCGDENRERGHRLRDRGETEDAACVTVDVDRAVSSGDTGRCEGHGPAVDLAERLHAARY